MADETVQTEIPVEAAVATDGLLPPRNPNSTDDVGQTDPIEVEQPTSAPVLDTDSPLFSRFRRLWNGGERRAAVEWAKVMNVAEDEWAALMGEFPELLDIINGN